MLKLLLSKSYIDVNKTSRTGFSLDINNITPLQTFLKYKVRSEKFTEILDVLLSREDLQLHSLSPDYFCIGNYSPCAQKIDVILQLFRDPRFELSPASAVC